MKAHRIRTAVTGALVAGAVALGGVSTHANADPVSTSTSSTGPNTWACVAVSYVHVGACVRNPFHERPHPRDVVRDAVEGLWRS